MSPTFDTTSSRAAKEDERHLHQRQIDIGLASNPYSTAIDGKRSRHVKCDQRNYFCANQVGLLTRDLRLLLTHLVF